MIIKQYIQDFEKLGFGMFVHFGLYSMWGRGEWAYHHLNEEEQAAYRAQTASFDPAPDWAEQLAATARAAGCRYITLTTRHHDGFSLFDTCGLSDFDAPHAAAGRDLVREFVDACRAEGIIPFFYHTLLDWYQPSYKENFKEYLVYLRASVELLCTRYGKIGGIWFDGMWNKPEEDWEEDALYGMIRSHQPEAMIINNTGLDARGALGHIELDSVTFERGKPKPINFEGAPKYVASEMCQIFALHWGYAKEDFHFKSLTSIIEDLCACRRYGSNFLLNVGPMGNGYCRPLDTAMLTALGVWLTPVKEAIYTPRPAGFPVLNKEKDFLLSGDGCYYLFCHDLPMKGSVNVVTLREDPVYQEIFSSPVPIRSAKWLDNDEALTFVQEGDTVTVHTTPFRYGAHRVVRIAKLTF